ncbi:hypothetical protein KSF78_0006856 [Schistosoma japonicum]|nr:hypothetical protein KSF78_0006856 [Schistosoma japonicum]
MYKNGYAIEKILQCKLYQIDYNQLLFWSGSICHLNNMKPTFQYLLIGKEYLYTMNYIKKQLNCRIHFSSILDVQYMNDLATFLTCQITRNYNHFCIEFIYDYKQSTQYDISNIKRNKHKCKKNVKAEKNKPNGLHNAHTDKHYDLHVYLTDTNFIGFEILQKALNIWYHSNKQFKNMITNLVHLNNLPIELLTTKQSITSSSSSAAAEAPMDGNIETLITNATRRNTVVYSTTAINEDLQQLMSMFKPFNKNSIRSSMKLSNQLHVISKDNLNKFDSWITESEIIRELVKKGQINNNLIHLINVQLNQLEHLINSIVFGYPLYFCTELCNKLIRIMEILMTQIVFLLPEQSIYLGNNELQEGNDKQITDIQTLDHRMKLVIHLMTIINSLLSYILPIFKQSNETFSLLNKDAIAIDVHVIVMRRKLKRIILSLIKHLMQLPCILNEFSLDDVDIKDYQKSNCFSIELETGKCQFDVLSPRDVHCPVSRRIFITCYKNDRMSKDLNYSSQWLQETIRNDTFSPKLSTIRRNFQNYTEFGTFLHQLNYQINCFNTTTNNNVPVFNREHKESISTMIRSLFIIDWLTEQYLCLIESLLNIGFDDYFHIFNIQYIISLTNKLDNKFTSYLPQMKLIKCVLIALVSRLHKKFERKTEKKRKKERRLFQ